MSDDVKSFPVQPAAAYNSWPMIRNIRSRVVCAYSKGSAHQIEESCRGVFARYSDDGGINWSPEVQVCHSAEYGDVTVGKGVDFSGSALFWIRRCRVNKNGGRRLELYQDLYRTADGITFEKIATPLLDPAPMQITDIFHIPEKNMLMSLWFAGDYQKGEDNSWGTVVSYDNGMTWIQRVAESGLPKAQWPSEQSAVYLGQGRIFAIARRETVRDENADQKVQFQLESEDYGVTWKKSLTNIGDILESTPSLLLTPEGKICNYYYQRGTGLLKRRTALWEQLWGHPLAWPEPEILTKGSTDGCHAGNVNAVSFSGKHLLAYYSGNATHTEVLVFPAEIP